MKKTSKKTARAQGKRKSTSAKSSKKVGFLGAIWKKIRSL